MTFRNIFFVVGSILTVLLALAAIYSPEQRLLAVILLIFILIGWIDAFQKKNAIIRDYPIIGHMRYILRAISPELQQYFIETNTNGQPFNKNLIKLINSRSDGEETFHPFGTEHNIYSEGMQWVAHSFFPAKKIDKDPRVTIGGPFCTQPYAASILNISAMSFGSLSGNAIKALNQGAALGGFYHNTGEGGLTPYHEHGGDVVLQIGTGNFGFRNSDGSFNDEAFAEKSGLPHVKMIEIKISQGAKPGHGGVLPAAKNTEEIAAIRKVKPKTDVFSPPVNPEIKTLADFAKFINRVRKLSNGKPVGIKLCIGSEQETSDLIESFVEQEIFPDFITIDAAEGGTGAAPIEYTNHIGMRGDDALQFMHQLLIDNNLRAHIKLIYSGKVSSGFTLLKALAFGADLCNSARGFMFSLGCIQSLRCHTDTCPTGIATQNKQLQKGLVVEHKKNRVKNYHNNTIESFIEILSTVGVSKIEDLKPSIINTAEPKVLGL